MIVQTDDPGTYLLWCPACDEPHQIVCPGWAFNGDLDRPTIHPSILVQGVQWQDDSPFHRGSHQVQPGEPTRCHSFVTGGRWYYLSDCTHSLAGQTVEGVPFHQSMQGDVL